MASDLLGVSVTGLRVSQAALSTVGHNIANAGTEGYSRQRVDPVTNPATRSSSGYIGNGANVNSIERVVNQFVTEQMRTDTTLQSDLENYHLKVSQVNNLLSDESTGLSGSLTSFFAAMQNGSDDPSSVSARQLVVSEAENLSDRFNTLYDRLNVINESVEDDMEVAVSEINALSANIAQLNVKISNAFGSGGDPNDLLDQRDAALLSLAALIPIQSFDQSNGIVNVIVGTGQALVVGTDSRRLVMGAGLDDSSKQDVFFVTPQRSEVITDFIKGGELGGMIRVRDELIDSVYNGLGRVALVMADEFNTQHSQGIDLEGEFGGDFFYDINSELVARNRVIPSPQNPNAESQVMALYVRDSAALPTSDYKVVVGGSGSIKITRTDTGAEVFNGLLSGQFPYSAEFDGLELTFEQGDFRSGDSFILRPTRSASRDFSVSVSSAEDIAFASPLLTDASLGNLGSGKISAGEVLALNDVDGNPLPLFATTGEMSPPLIVVFNTATSYDILDNSDPGNPVHLDPPIRDRRYVPGVSNMLFSTDPNETMVTTSGEMVGLPDGRSAVSQAALFPSAVAPDFTTTDFSATGNQFSFDLVVSNTSGGVNNGTFSVTINGGAIVDNDALLLNINAQLSTTDVRAFIADSGALAFRLNTAGYGNIAVQNYDADPDGNADSAAAGLANNLLGFDVEGSTFTTVANANGSSGAGALTNGYPSEIISIHTPNNNGIGSTQTRVLTQQHGTARELASNLSNVKGVEANASTYAELSNVQVNFDVPLQIELNGQALIEYGVVSATGAPIISQAVPNATSDPDGFYDYLADRINSNATFKAEGIYAVAAVDPISGDRELRVFSTEGDDLQFGLTSATSDSISISDGENSNVALTGNGVGVKSQVVVGGKIDISLADGITISTQPRDSMLFGDAQATGFAQSTYLGIQASITGTPSAGDTFTFDFNHNANSDNRNALGMVDLETRKVLGGVASLDQGYGVLVEKVGIETSSAKINRDAADQVLLQTNNLRDSISGVNLDEEAADLIRYEQLFSANAQVISVARDIFDRLIGSF